MVKNSFPTVIEIPPGAKMEMEAQSQRFHDDPVSSLSSNKNDNSIYPSDKTHVVKETHIAHFNAWETKTENTEETCVMLDFLGNLRIDKSTAQKYCRAMLDNGFDDVPSLNDANEEDLKEIGIKIGHVRRMKRAASTNAIPMDQQMYNRNTLYDDIYPSDFRRDLPDKAYFAKDAICYSRQQRPLDKSIENKLKKTVSSKSMGALESAIPLRLISGESLKKYPSGWNGSTTSDVISSVTDIDQAKIKIKMQADRIRDLESTIAKTSSKKKIKKKKPSRILSPEERLQAHRKRKMMENKYKETSFQWEKPPDLPQEHLVQKVKKKDNLVERLRLGPSERRRQHEIRRKSNEMSRNSTNSSSNQENNLLEKKSINMISETGRKIMSAAALATAHQNGETSLHSSLMGLHTEAKAQQKRGVLVNRLNVGANYKNTRNDVPDSRNHRCDTCDSNYDCEEDIDNPGTFYCKTCWDEYDKFCVQKSFESHSSTYHSPNMHLMNNSNQVFTPRSVTTPISSTQINDQALWILHDNPQLGNKLLINGRAMKCWIETKDPEKKNSLRVMIGRIDFSGQLSRASLDGIRLVENLSIGTECIRLRDVVGYVVNFEAVDTRPSREKTVIEFQIKKSNGVTLTGENAQVSTKTFFENCKGCIDIILDPQCSSGDWYPFREATSMRKLAPQFRSRGVGYIRLGDDMSKNGLAFLSNDGCKTFFSSIPKNSISKGRHGELYSKHSNLASGRISEVLKDEVNNTVQKNDVKSSKFNQHDSGDGKNSSSIEEGKTDDWSDENSTEGSGDPKELLKQLEESDGNTILKWDEKADLVSRLGEAISRPSGICCAGQALTYLQDILSSKNINIFVLRSTIQSVARIAYSLGNELVCHVAWRTIFVEMLKLLKNKQVALEVRKTLVSTHGRCFSLSNSMELIYQALGLGQARRPVAAKNGKRGTSTSIDIDKKSANHIEIIEWLASTVVKESKMTDLDAMVDIDSLEILSRFFISHLGHRDQQCRKHVYNGIVHTIVYGLNLLHMPKEQAFSLLFELKTTNPKAWETIINRTKIYLQ